MKHSDTNVKYAPFNRSYWVVPGKLIAGCYPGDKDKREADKKLTALINSGIRHVISLMEPDERDHSGGLFSSYDDHMESLAKEMKVSVTFDQIPIKDQSVPSERQMVRILNQIDLCIRLGKPVFVHCWGGRGRTGAVVGCYLARHGIASGKDALAKMVELRRKTVDAGLPSPETSKQIQIVVNWQAGK